MLHTLWNERSPLHRPLAPPTLLRFQLRYRVWTGFQSAEQRPLHDPCGFTAFVLPFSSCERSPQASAAPFSILPEAAPPPECNSFEAVPGKTVVHAAELMFGKSVVVQYSAQRSNVLSVQCLDLSSLQSLSIILRGGASDGERFFWSFAHDERRESHSPTEALLQVPSSPLPQLDAVPLSTCRTKCQLQVLH